MAVGQQSSRILEFDAVSGCQRAAVDCRFMPSAMELTPDGASLVLFAKVRWGAPFARTPRPHARRAGGGC